MAQVFTKTPVKNFVEPATATFERVFDRFPSFWRIQIAGWALYLVMMYVTFLTVAAEGMLFSLFEIKLIRTVIGFSLTCVMRSIYRRFGTKLSIQKAVLLVLCCSIIFGCFWTLFEMEAASLRNPDFSFANNWVRLPRNALDYGLTLTAWSALYFGIKYWRAWQQERENALASAAMANQAQLEMLRYQLNPHFLFNSLNSIRALIDEDARRAKQMVTQLSEFLRYSLVNNEAKTITLGEELEAVRNYLAIEKIRFDEKLEVEYSVEEKTTDFPVPAFLLNPLIENAIKHGFDEKSKRLKIIISARLENGFLHLEAANTGTLKSNKSETKVGLKNVRERLEKIYGGYARFEISESNNWVRSAIFIKSNENESLSR